MGGLPDLALAPLRGAPAPAIARRSLGIDRRDRNDSTCLAEVRRQFRWALCCLPWTSALLER